MSTGITGALAGAVVAGGIGYAMMRPTSSQDGQSDAAGAGKHSSDGRINVLAATSVAAPLGLYVASQLAKSPGLSTGLAGASMGSMAALMGVMFLGMKGMGMSASSTPAEHSPGAADSMTSDMRGMQADADRSGTVRKDSPPKGEQQQGQMPPVSMDRVGDGAQVSSTSELKPNGSSPLRPELPGAMSGMSMEPRGQAMEPANYGYGTDPFAAVGVGATQLGPDDLPSPPDMHKPEPPMNTRNNDPAFESMVAELFAQDPSMHRRTAADKGSAEVYGLFGRSDPGMAIPPHVMADIEPEPLA